MLEFCKGVVLDEGERLGSIKDAVVMGLIKEVVVLELI